MKREKNDRAAAKARALELMAERAGVTVRQFATCLVDEGMYTGEAFHAQRAAVSYARSILRDLVKSRRVRVIERTVSTGGDLYLVSE